MRRHFSQLLVGIMLLLLTACSSATNGPSSQTQTILQAQTTPTPSTVIPVVQQPLPKGLLSSNYPVIDWVFSRTCSLAVSSYSSSQVNTTIAYDSAAWLYPSDGHLVEGSQDCDKDTLIGQARNRGMPTLLTVGIDSSWSAQDSASYIDRAASQPQVPCTAQTTTYICNIVNWALAGGYAGIIIDFEIVQWNYPGIGLKFGTFMQELQSALHQKGLLCGVTLISKVSDTPEDPLYKVNNFEDWKLLSKVDFLVDMVLDQDITFNKPGPITSAPWIEKQLDYLWQTAPQALSKLIFELPFYGREWQQDASGKWSIVSDETCQQVSVQKATQSLLPGVSTDTTTPEFAWNDQNGNRHEVWYNNASSLLAIMTQVQQKARSLLNNPHYKLPTSFWYRGAECSNFFGTGNALATFYQN